MCVCVCVCVCVFAYVCTCASSLDRILSYVKEVDLFTKI